MPIDFNNLSFEEQQQLVARLGTIYKTFEYHIQSDNPLYPEKSQCITVTRLTDNCACTHFGDDAQKFIVGYMSLANATQIDRYLDTLFNLPDIYPGVPINCLKEAFMKNEHILSIDNNYRSASITLPSGEHLIQDQRLDIIQDEIWYTFQLVDLSIPSKPRILTCHPAPEPLSVREALQMVAAWVLITQALSDMRVNAQTPEALQTIKSYCI